MPFKMDWKIPRNGHSKVSVLFENLIQAFNASLIFSVVDGWGKFPSGIYNYNFFDPGSFSECFHIERNGVNYKTQYCIGQLILETPEQRNAKKVQKIVDELPFRQRLGFYNIGPSISLGICLPSACAVDDLESSLNRIVHRKLKDMTVRIDKDYCQIEETPSKFTTIDFIALQVVFDYNLCSWNFFSHFGYFYSGLLATVVVLMIASTAYDVFCDAFNCKLIFSFYFQFFSLKWVTPIIKPITDKKCQPLLVYSIYTNGKKLFSYESTTSPHIIQCLHGIRSMTTISMIASHTYYVFFFLPSREYMEFVKVFKSSFHKQKKICEQILFLYSQRQSVICWIFAWFVCLIQTVFKLNLFAAVYMCFI